MFRAVVADTISNWCHATMKEAGVDTRVHDTYEFRASSTSKVMKLAGRRKLASSKAGGWGPIRRPGPGANRTCAGTDGEGRDGEYERGGLESTGAEKPATAKGAYKPSWYDAESNSEVFDDKEHAMPTWNIQDRHSVVVGPFNWNVNKSGRFLPAEVALKMFSKAD